MNKYASKSTDIQTLMRKKLPRETVSETGREATERKSMKTALRSSQELLSSKKRLKILQWKRVEILA